MDILKKATAFTKLYKFRVAQKLVCLAWNRWQQQTDSSRPYLGALQSNRSYNKCNTCSGPNALDAGTNTDPFGAVKGVSKIAGKCE